MPRFNTLPLQAVNRAFPARRSYNLDQIKLDLREEAQTVGHPLQVFRLQRPCIAGPFLNSYRASCTHRGCSAMAIIKELPTKDGYEARFMGPLLP